MTNLLQEMKERCKEIVFLKGTGTDKIKKSFPDAPVYDSLKDALNKALDLAGGKGVILFSPAFASFGMFKNEYDRGDQFIALVKQLL
jgi:UDP-N-acetylmuramoylalanine--D-glutamate ligase